MSGHGSRWGGVVLVAVMSVAGCGCGSDVDGDQVAAVRAAVVEFGRGLTSGSAEQLAATLDTSCRPYADALLAAFEVVGASSRHVEIASVDVVGVDGDHATVSVRFNGDTQVGGVNVQTTPLSIELDLDGGHWLVDCESFGSS